MTSLPFEDNPEMQRFVHQVQERTELDSYAEAEQLTRATVAALGAVVSGGQATQLAQWLPEPLRADLADSHGQAGRLGKEQFLEKIGGQIHTVDLDQVQLQAIAVLQVLRAAAPHEQVHDTLAQLPPTLAAMFD